MMKNILQKGRGWPVLIAALVLGFGGAAWSAMAKNHWPFIIGFGLDVLLVIGYILTCDEEGEPNALMNADEEENDTVAPEAPADAPVETDPATEEAPPEKDSAGHTPAAE